MIKSKEEYVKMLVVLAENGELYKTLYERGIDGSLVEQYDKDLEILDQLLDYENFNKSFEHGSSKEG